MAEQESDHDTQEPNTTQNCPPEDETGILLLNERNADREEESDEFESLREEWDELDKGSEAALSQESSPSQQANFRRQYNTLKEHSTVLIDKLQAEVEKKKEQINQLDKQKQAIERENCDLQRRIDMKENEMKKMQIELDKKEDQLSEVRHKNSAHEEKRGDMQKQLQALEHAHKTLRRENELRVKESRNWLNLCEKFKQGNPPGEDAEIDKQIELLTSATPLIKPEIVFADHGKDSIAGQTSNGTLGVEAPSGVKIQLVKGDIVQHTADVKVVATTSDFGLSKGAVRALLNAGGKKLKDDCKKQYLSRRRDDVIIVVNGEESVRCREMYLAPLRTWKERDISNISKAMATSLKLAHAQRHNSILFAAIGTGPLNYPKDRVAKEVYQAVIDFTETHTLTLKDIGFVMYDPGTTSAFEAEERFRKIHAKPAYVCDIGQIKFQIVIGDILEQRANAIIYEVDLNFKGRKAQTLKQICPEVARTIQSRQRELERDGLTVMKNAEFPTRMLICVTFKGVSLRWRRILGCLEKANEEGCRTVSCSLYAEEQTRSTVSDTEEITSSLLTAVEEFSQKYKDSNIKSINYVLAECDEDKLTAVVELLQSMILRAEKRKRKEKGQIVGILLSQNVK